MDVIQVGNKTKLVIETDQEQLQDNKAKLIFMGIMLGIVGIVFVTEGLPWWSIVFWIGAWTVYGLLCIQEGYKVILNRFGCQIEFWKFKRYLTWEEIKYKNYVCGGRVPERFDIAKYETRKYRYDEGIVFSKHKNRILRWLSPLTFNINFYQKGISKGNGDYHSLLDAYEIKTGKRPKTPVKEIKRLLEVHVADRKEFLSYMALWGIEIENLSVIDRLDYGIKDYPSEKNN